MPEHCSICDCELHRTRNTYAQPTVLGRSHATEHHYVAERFFGRSANRPGTVRDPIFDACPWGFEGRTAVFCYECHEDLLHNPVLLPRDLRALADLVRSRDLSEEQKADDRSKLSGRIQLFHEVIAAGLEAMGRCPK